MQVYLLHSESKLIFPPALQRDAQRMGLRLTRTVVVRNGHVECHPCRCVQKRVKKCRGEWHGDRISDERVMVLPVHLVIIICSDQK